MSTVSHRSVYQAVPSDFHGVLVVLAVKNDDPEHVFISVDDVQAALEDKGRTARSFLNRNSFKGILIRDGTEYLVSLISVKEFFYYCMLNQSPKLNRFRDHVAHILDVIQKTGSYPPAGSRDNSLEWTKTREKGKDDRRYFTETIRKQGIKPPPGKTDGFQFAGLTNAIYEGVDGMNASELRKRLGLKSKDSLRDNRDADTLSLYALSERAAANKMISSDIHEYDRGRLCSKRAAQVITEGYKNAMRQLQDEKI